MVLAALDTFGLMQAAGAGILGSSILLLQIRCVLLPILAYDWLRFGRLHQAWVVGLALYLPFVLLTCALWLSPAWHAFASSLLGY